ncbi:MAG: hypothetical protein JNK50_13655 [Bacteroidia bacterium]|nr:hypothetical protein [Bacteroidia bacterium]
MKLSLFKKLAKKYSNLPLSKDIQDIDDFNKYQDALLNDKKCTDWVLKQQIKSAGLNPNKYCCLDMGYHLIEAKKTKRKTKINYDTIIITTKSKEFGIPIHDGGTSFIKINYCPWCGHKLK